MQAVLLLMLVLLQGRLLLWGWLQERRKVGAYDYSGCLTVPRVLHLRGDKLHQTPAEEVDKLRTGQSWCELPACAFSMGC
jgi:sucrose-6-phosphate hydrolase SacC (GH32 family)